MTKNSARKKAIRARRAATGEAYNAARRALDRDQDPTAAVWVLVHLTLDPEPDGRAIHLSQQDRAAIALALSKAWQYAEVPCPRAVVWQVSGGRDRVVLLARLTFTRPHAGGGLTAEDSTAWQAPPGTPW